MFTELPSTTSTTPDLGPLWVSDGCGRYVAESPLTDREILAAAAQILLHKCHRLGEFTSAATAKQFLQIRLAGLENEHFIAVWLDSRHRILAVETLSQGTIDGASVYPRVVVASAIRHNASAVTFAHNHPSGITEPSAADRALTVRLRDALAHIDVRVLDHVVVGTEGCTSFAERGWV